MIKLEKVNKYFNRHRRNQIHIINNTSLELEPKGLVAGKKLYLKVSDKVWVPKSHYFWAHFNGGDKGNDYSEIDALVKEKCHTLIFMGKDNSKLIQHFEALGYSPNTSPVHRLSYISTHTLQDAVQAAYQAANHGDTVLLSPCCASFDLFKNYEDRGEQFSIAVRNL